MSTAILLFIDGTLWAVNAVMWSFYANSRLMGVATGVVSAVCYYFAWRQGNNYSLRRL